MAGAAPILMGGTFTPTWHIVGCPCDDCIRTRRSLDGLGKFLDELDKDPVKKAEWQAKVRETLGKHNRKRRAVKKPHRCDCCHCRRY